MSLSGAWENSYGSTMNLVQYDDGYVVGQYSSSTGSTGVYWVVGHADPTAPTDKGQAVALSIYWRSISGGDPNPTWHYVSGFSGQLVGIDGTPSLVLLHAMVDSDDSPGPGGLGTYLDKLVYTPSVSSQAGQDAPKRLQDADNVADPVCGTWATTTGPTLSVDIFGADPDTGFVLGTMTADSGSGLACVGFTDVTAEPDGLALQSLSLSAFNTADGTVWSLAGTLDFSAGVLTLLQMQSHGTSSENLYAQTTATEYVLTKAD